jgi:hypothetical protein
LATTRSSASTCTASQGQASPDPRGKLAIWLPRSSRMTTSFRCISPVRASAWSRSDRTTTTPTTARGRRASSTSAPPQAFPPGGGHPPAGCHSRRTSATCERMPRTSGDASASRTPSSMTKTSSSAASTSTLAGRSRHHRGAVVGQRRSGGTGLPAARNRRQLARRRLAVHRRQIPHARLVTRTTASVLGRRTISVIATATDSNSVDVLLARGAGSYCARRCPPLRTCLRLASLRVPLVAPDRHRRSSVHHEGRTKLTGFGPHDLAASGNDFRESRRQRTRWRGRKPVRVRNPRMR